MQLSRLAICSRKNDVEYEKKKGFVVLHWILIDTQDQEEGTKFSMISLPITKPSFGLSITFTPVHKAPLFIIPSIYFGHHTLLQSSPQAILLIHSKERV